MIKPEDISIGITVFIDILGFGNRIAKIETVTEIQSIYKELWHVQKQFYYKPTEKIISHINKLYNKKVLAFSDCLVIHIPLKSKATQSEGDFDPLMSEFLSLAYSQAACVLDSIFLRGGIDIGWWYSDQDIIISKSLLQAYHLEQSISVPVIAITNDVFEYFSNHPHRKWYAPEVDPLSIFRKGIVDNKEIIFLDYMTICLEGLDWRYSKEQVERYNNANKEERQRIINEGYQYNIDYWLKKHGNNIRNAYNATENDKIKSKYSWLATYHNNIAELFTDNEEAFIELK
ncbi:hypothetical protein TDIS_0737 [Thermosulfurimonas dismutans]|uniref:Uncharacterized protein n=2 Tax=Thermosulfurimonas dismutans TaxID=999894 RepID=A0A179D4T4_9BACT|nr:hypothetical protein TDIS_0737 [Thermosulfurimonas dismutans]